MKKFLLLLAAVGMIFTACEPANGLDEDNNGNNTEQPGGGRIVALQREGQSPYIALTYMHADDGIIRSGTNLLSVN